MDKITFSFGKNWAEYADTVDAQAIETAKRTLKEWLGQERIPNRKSLISVLVRGSLRDPSSNWGVRIWLRSTMTKRAWLQPEVIEQLHRRDSTSPWFYS